MGEIRQGILGPFSGKVGTVVGSIRKGHGYMRALAPSKKDAKTVAQLTQRMKFSMAHQLLKPVVPYMRVGFRGYTGSQTPYNAGTSYAVRICIVGKYQFLGFDPSKLVLSEGSLEGVETYSASVSNNKVSFMWADNSNDTSAKMEDFAMPVIYNFSKCKAVYSTDKVSRVDTKAELTIPASWKNDKLSCYISFASVKNNAVSDTIYIGDVKSDGSVEEGINGIILPNGSSTDKSDNEPTVPSGGGSSSSSGSSTGDGGGSSTGDNSGSSSSGGQGDGDHKELD